MMKWLFLILLCTNIGFFAWNQSRDLPVASRPSPSSPPVPGGKQLVLVSEAEVPVPSPTARETALPPSGPAHKPPSPGMEQRPEAVARTSNSAPEEKEDVKVKPQPPAAPARCFLVSDIESEEARERFAALIQKQGGQISGRGTSRLEQTRFWVMVPPFPSPDAAAPVLRRLKERGETDYYFIRSGENRFAISLGVFSTREIADRRMRQMREGGFQPELRPVGFTAVRYKLDVSFKKEPPSNWQAQLPYGATVESKPCH